MSLWSHLWSLTRLPLSLLGAIALVVAGAEPSWLLVACLTLGLLEQADAALHKVRQAMRSSTRMVLQSYLLAPLALIADLLIRWGQ